MDELKITIDPEKTADFCRRWKITELSLFGSFLRDDFRPDSDVDVLVTFAPEARWTLIDLADMEAELEAMLGRKVELVSKRGLLSSSNDIRVQAILQTARVIHAA